MAKPSSNAQLCLDSAHLSDDAAGIPADHWSRLFFAHVFSAFGDAQFADLYEEGGRCPVSPSLLAAVTILQYLFRVSDRAAVENTIMRRDWRMALGITPDYEGFCPTVLVRFRQRLQREGRMRQLFDTVLQRVEQLGLLSGRRRVRVDATHLVADVSRLSRAEMIQEAMRVVVRHLHDRYPELRQQPGFMVLYETYAEEVWLGSGSSGVQKLSRLGADGWQLLQWCGERPVKGQQVLAQILAENFCFPDDGPPQPLDEQQRPPDRIVTPHEPDVRVGRQGERTWWGDKVHVVETADPGGSNFLVDVVVTDPRTEDSTVLPEIAQRTAFRLPEADTLIADGGYASAANTQEAQAAGLQLVSPPRPDTRRSQIPASEFEFDFERRVVRCPEGQETDRWYERGRELTIQFPAAVCGACPRRAQCTRGKGGRHLGVSRHYAQLQRDRQRAQQPCFGRVYRLRAPVEATISHLVHGCGLRRSRYRTAAGRAFHALGAATALNARRLLSALGARWTLRPVAVQAAAPPQWVADWALACAA